MRNNPGMLDAFVDARGGADSFAEKLGARVNTVRVWRSRGFIPRPRWPDVIRAFPEVTLADLEAIEAAHAQDAAA